MMAFSSAHVWIIFTSLQISSIVKDSSCIIQAFGMYLQARRETYCYCWQNIRMSCMTQNQKIQEVKSGN